ncbi:MAG: ABC transporter permease subunit, partial [Ilumatobacteraceae bacterium]|nr:ABC transporter permease subunit [Ilumatobacteraceae bacterium]
MAATVAPPRKRGWRAPKYLLAIPSMAWYTAFFVLPIAFIVLFSFGTKDITKRVPVDLGNLSLDNYHAVLFESTNRDVFFTSMQIALIATLLCLVIGLPVAYFIAFKVREKWRGIVLAAVIVPSFTSFLVRTVAWRIPLAANGNLSRWLQDWGVIDGPISILETRGAVQLAIVYNYLGFMILPLFVAFDRIESGMREASKDLGAGRFSTFVGVTLPLAGPGIVAGSLLTFIPMCGDYVTAVILGGAKGYMIGKTIAAQFGDAQNWPLGSAMAVLMILGVLVVLAVGALIVWLAPKVAQLFSPVSRSVRASMYRRNMSTIPGKRPDWFGSIFRVGLTGWSILVLVFLFLPIALIILFSFNRGELLTLWSGHISVKWWQRVFNPGRVGSTLLLLAVLIIIGLGAARLARRGKSDGAKVAARWIPPLTFLGAFLIAGSRTNWYRTLFRDINVGDPIRNSAIAALGATVISVVLGGLSGVALARHPGKWSKIFMAMIFLILVTPEIMDAVALVGWVQRVGGPFRNDIGPIKYGYIRLWMGQSLYASAVVTLIVRARLAGVDTSLEEAAGDLGAPPGRAFRQITLPLISSALVAGGLLSFTLCLDNTIISNLLADAGSSTFPVALIGALAKGTPKPFYAVAAVVLFAIT